MLYVRIMRTGVERWEGVGRRKVKLGETTSGVKHFVYFTLSGQILNFLTLVVKKSNNEKQFLREKANSDQVLYKLPSNCQGSFLKVESLNEALSLLRAHLQRTHSVGFADCSSHSESHREKEKGRALQDGVGTTS